MHAETVFKGATRPATLFGVPLVPLVALAGTAVLLMLWSGIFVSGWIAILVPPIAVGTFIWMRQVTKRDDQRFRQAFLALKLHHACPNRGFWNARSYAANTYRGNEERWHA